MKLRFCTFVNVLLRINMCIQSKEGVSKSKQRHAISFMKNLQFRVWKKYTWLCGREEILESNNSDLLENKEALEFMRQNGPDTLINCVSLNIKEYNHHRFASLWISSASVWIISVAFEFVLYIRLNEFCTVVGQMTIFDLWPIPLGGGAWGAGTNMWHPETSASYASLSAPQATQIPILCKHTSGWRGHGGLWY